MSKGQEMRYTITYRGGDEMVKGNPWKGKSFFSLASEDGEIVSLLDEDKSCNTKKTKDKRERQIQLA